MSQRFALSIYTCPCCGGELTRDELIDQDKAARGPKPQPLVSRPPAVANARTRMWTSMRIQRNFSSQSLAATSSATVPATRNFVNALRQAGYLRLTHETSFEAGDHSRFLLILDTGPHAPRLRASGKAVFDPNTRTEVARVRP